MEFKSNYPVNLKGALLRRAFGKVLPNLTGRGIKVNILEIKEEYPRISLKRKIKEKRG